MIEGESWDAMAHADVALVASGTVTVEAALLGTPMVAFADTPPAKKDAPADKDDKAAPAKDSKDASSKDAKKDTSKDAKTTTKAPAKDSKDATKKDAPAGK